MHLDKGHVDAAEGVDEGDGRVRPCAGIDDDERRAVGARRVDAVEHCALGIRLERSHGDVGGRTARLEAGENVDERRVAVPVRTSVSASQPVRRTASQPSQSGL